MPDPGEPLTAEALFEGHADGLVLYRAVRTLVAGLGPAEERVTKSQVAFRRRRGFAYVWVPGRYVRSTVPAVLSVALPRHEPSPRFKAVAHPSARIWMHHLELRTAAELDDEVVAWVEEAYEAAG